MIPRITTLILIIFYNVCVSYGKPFGYDMYPDYTYVESTKSYYKQYIGQSWTDAVATCSSEGAQMYYPEDENELQEVAGLISYVYAGDRIWIGISDLRMNASYETVDGRPIKDVYHKWTEGEPTSGFDGDLHCVTLRIDGTLWVGWCPVIRDFVCKISPKITTNSNTGIETTTSHSEETTTEVVEREIKPSNKYNELHEGKPFGINGPQDYIYFESTKSFYKHHDEEMSWTDAVATCSSEGALLFYPEDESELQALAELIRFVDAYNKIWIGISDQRMNASYETIDGRSIKDVYHKWMESEPSSGPGGDCHCVTLQSDGTLWVGLCIVERQFICKIYPEINQNTIGTENTTSNLEEKTTEAVEREIELSIPQLSGLSEGNPIESSVHQDYVYVESTKSFYKYHDEVMTWTDAVATCSSEGAQLFYPEDETDVRAVAEVKKFIDSYDKIWVGISDLQKHTNYETIDGRSIRDIYHKWSAGEPWSGTGGDYHCVTLKGDETLWVSLCSNKSDFVCKRSTDVNQDNNTRTDTPSSFPMTTTEAVESAKPNKTLMYKDYTYLKSTNSYYKYHGGPKCTWHDAVAACSSEGAQLFYPEDETEATEVGEVLNIWHNISLIWIGVSDLQEIKKYITTDGRPITNVFHKWNSGEPSSGENDSCRCVVLWYYNALTVRECNALMNFVCKYTPETNQHHKNDTDTTPANSNKTTQAIEGKLCRVGESWQPCEEVDAGSKSHLPFLNVVGEELGYFPPREKLAVMESILRVIREHRTKLQEKDVKKL